MQNQSIFLVYETDEHHSTYSSCLCGIFTSRESAIEAIVNHHNIPLNEFRDYFDEDEALDYNDEWYKNEVKSIIRNELDGINQTQGFSINYTIESCTLDDPWF